MAQRIRVATATEAAEFSRRLNTMLDDELEWQLVQVTEQHRALVAFESLDALAEKHRALSQANCG